MARPLDGASRMVCDWAAWYGMVIIEHYQLTPTINIYFGQRRQSSKYSVTVGNRVSTNTLYFVCDHLSHSHQIYQSTCTPYSASSKYICACMYSMHLPEETRQTKSSGSIWTYDHPPLILLLLLLQLAKLWKIPNRQWDRVLARRSFRGRCWLAQSNTCSDILCTTQSIP